MHLHKLDRPLRRTRLSMNTSNQRIDALRQLMELEQRRSMLQTELDEILARTAALQSDILSEAPAPRRHHASANNYGADSNTTRAHRMGRGELRLQIVESLRAAGDKGVLVKELSTLLRMKSVNIHSWFHSAIQRFPQIRKASPGRYVLVGELNLPELPSPNAHGRALNETTVKSSRRSRSKRGEVTRLIMQNLDSAGDNGITVQELAGRIGANYRNVHVWFSSTGKKNPLIQKMNRGKYRLLKRHVVSHSEPALANAGV
jgi:hypothetical protein